jgi:hypothetical protein
MIKGKPGKLFFLQMAKAIVLAETPVFYFVVKPINTP